MPRLDKLCLGVVDFDRQLEEDEAFVEEDSLGNPDEKLGLS